MLRAYQKTNTVKKLIYRKLGSAVEMIFSWSPTLSNILQFSIKYSGPNIRLTSSFFWKLFTHILNVNLSQKLNKTYNKDESFSSIILEVSLRSITRCERK